MAGLVAVMVVGWAGGSAADLVVAMVAEAVEGSVADLEVVTEAGLAVGSAAARVAAVVETAAAGVEAAKAAMGVAMGAGDRALQQHEKPSCLFAHRYRNAPHQRKWPFRTLKGKCKSALCMFTADGPMH